MKSNKRTIVFAGSTLYLSLSQYLPIAKNLEECVRVFLYLKDPASEKFDRSFLKLATNSKHFDFCFKVDDTKIKFDKGWKAQLKYKKCVLNILHKINPCGIIACSDMSLSSRILITYCKSKCIPFFIMQPSFIESGFLHNRKGLLDNFKYFFVNKILRIPIYRRQNLFGNEDKLTHLILWSKFFNRNPKRRRTYFVGNPAFDVILRDFSLKRVLKGRIVICSQVVELYGVDIFHKINKIYDKAIKSFPEKIFYLKLHPRESFNKYNNIFNKDEHPNLKIIKNKDLYEIFKLCDLQISAFSFTTFEAAAIGLPVITINPGIKINIVDLFREEIDLRVSSIDNIVDAIEYALSEEYWEIFVKKREKYFKKVLTYIDDKSGQRAAELIIKILPDLLKKNLKEELCQ